LGILNLMRKSDALCLLINLLGVISVLSLSLPGKYPGAAG
jgi:hypothetical protein